MERLTEIISIEAPPQAFAGLAVTIKVTIGNRYSEKIKVTPGETSYIGETPEPPPIFPVRVHYDEGEIELAPGTTHTWVGHFMMPSQSVVIHARSFYKATDGQWYQDDELVVTVEGEEDEIPDDDDGGIFDKIFEWIANAIKKILEGVSDFFSWLWDKIVDLVTTWIDWVVTTVVDWFNRVKDWISEVSSNVWDWISETASNIWDWITETAESLGNSIWEWIQDLWTDITDWFSNLWDNIVTWFTSLGENIAAFFEDLWERLQAGWDFMVDWMDEHIVKPIEEWWSTFFDKLLDFGSWIGDLLQAVWEWVNRDVPGHSPWWQDAIYNVFYFIYSWLILWPTDMASKTMEYLSPTLIQILKPIGELFNSVAEIFLDAVDDFIAELGQTNPDIAGDNARSLGAVGMIALAGLAGMTLASSWLKPLGGAGMGQIAAMIYDMTNYKLITGAAIGALTFCAIKQPMTYHYNEIFRPWLLSQADFMELMCRKAFTDPETLRTPELIDTVHAVTGGNGAAYEHKMLGYYGYPDFYYGFFKELSFSPLRYFPLAGIARTGFYDEAWFAEALARSGYSPTAQEALKVMYREMVLTARQASAMYQLRRLSREGFATMEEIRTHLDNVAALTSLTECRLYAMDLEQQYARKELAFDIIMGAFSKHIIDESAAMSGLSSLGVPGDLLDLHMLREKLGLARKITIPAEAAAITVPVGEE